MARKITNKKPNPYLNNRTKITKENITQDLLKQLLDYDPATGALTRKHLSDDMLQYFRRNDITIWNRKAGKPITNTFRRKNSHYITTRLALLGESYIASRIIWLYMTGDWPDHQIDHIDGDGSNNRWDNLRDVTAIVNNRNKKLFKTNKSGHLGVYEEKHVKGPNRWKAQAFVLENGNRRHISLGYHPTIEQAVAARKAWEDTQGNFSDRHGT